ncbi:MAG: glycosyltransferase [Promethearchaeota archaeon]
MVNKIIVFCSFSNFKSGKSGDTINNRKLVEALPSSYQIIVLQPRYEVNNRIKTISFLKFLVLYLKEVISSDRIFITRGLKLSLIPIIFKPIFKNRIIVFLGCTPIRFLERKFFSKNKTTKNILSSDTILNKIFYTIEPILEHFAIKNADKFIVENVKAKKILIINGADSQKIEIIPYYVQDYFIKAKNLEYDKNKDYFEIGYTGNFQKYDLLIPILEALQLLKEKYKIRLNLIGDGPQRKLIKSRVKKMRLEECVLFHGSKTHEEVAILIEKFHCILAPMVRFICPSTIAIKILESIMKGKIIITTRSGNNPSLFLGTEELLLDNPSASEIAEKLNLIIERYEYYKQLAIKLRNFHVKFRTKTNYRKKIENLINKMIKIN